MRKFMRAFNWENVMFIFYALTAIAGLVLIACDRYMMGPFK